ncbi:ABC transporter permease, partial [Streptomyces albiflaviniger]|nr:ABC transporter permease [Streptomyces albiflaviniger]
MIVRLVQRIAILLAGLAVSSVLVFAFMAVLPGDPARVALGTSASDSAVAQLRQEFGLDRPLVAQYLSWVHGLVTFDPGNSYISHAPIGPQLADRLQVTLWLVGAGMVIACLLALPMGTLMAVRHRKPSGLILSALSQVGVAIPAFLAGILLIPV